MRRHLPAAVFAAAALLGAAQAGAASRLLCDNGAPPLDNGVCLDGSVAHYREQGDAVSGGGAEGAGAGLGISEAEAKRRQEANQKCISMRAVFPNVSCMLQ